MSKTYACVLCCVIRCVCVCVCVWGGGGGGGGGGGAVECNTLQFMGCVWVSAHQHAVDICWITQTCIVRREVHSMCCAITSLTIISSVIMPASLLILIYHSEAWSNVPTFFRRPFNPVFGNTFLKLLSNIMFLKCVLALNFDVMFWYGGDMMGHDFET